MKRLLSILTLLLMVLAPIQSKDIMSLSGEWRIVLDGNYREVRERTGVTQEWFKKELPTNKDVDRLNRIYFQNQPFVTKDWISLPGTTDEAGIGSILEYSSKFTPGLERLKTYEDAFWVQRKVQIPESWTGTRVTLFLERVLGATRAYWDGKLVGQDYGYAYSHVIELDVNVASGEHLLTILVNKNDYRYAQTGHHVTNQNGCSWNGIVGRIELQSRRNEGFITSKNIYPNITKGSIDVRMGIKGTDAKQVRFGLRRKGVGQFKSLSTIDVKQDSIDCNLKVPTPIHLWNEFSPNLYELQSEVVLSNGKVSDSQITTFGMREVATKEGSITINGLKVFMRGTLDCGSAPISGYPDMGKDEWMRIMRVCKSYGLNHIRFHTWCPPTAAFEAADELGVYLQPELAGVPYTEINRVLDSYGNHPSFCMLVLNNEAFSHNDATRKIIGDAKHKDARHLYSCTSHPAKADCTDDFYVSASNASWKRIVGINHGGGDVVSTTRFNLFAPETASNYAPEISGANALNAPIISHEVGQWAMFPDLSEIAKYSGVLKNTNYERIRKSLTERGMLPQAADFALSSGRFSSVLYKEEMESALRTPNFAGFQLLDIHDFQGQYISIVGILNSFWESKGIVDAATHSQYCNTVVPLALLSKRVWKNNETLEAQIQVANYGAAALKTGVEWSLTNSQGKILKKGSLSSRTIAQGGLTDCGIIRITCEGITKAEQAILTVTLPGAKVKNQWDVWIYPQGQTVSNDKVKVFKGFSNEVKDALQRGESVLLSLAEKDLIDSRDPCFTTIFWNSFHKWPQKAHTMGILVDPKHPLFENFPTDFHSNWQWWDITMNARSMKIKETSSKLEPLVQVIDSHMINDKLAYLWECRVGNGKLIVSSIDFETNISNRGASQQLKYALLKYMNSEQFAPKLGLEYQHVMDMLR